jgi:uncharacterized membrane protein
MRDNSSAILGAVVGFPLSIIGIVGSVMWYNSLRSGASEDVAAMSGIGPMILGFFSFLLLLWSGGLLLVGLLLAKKSVDEYKKEMHEED